MAQPEPQLPGLPRNYLAATVLLVLVDGAAHGYDLLRPLADLGLEGIDTGRLYRTLRRLESDGLLTSWWDQSDSGPARRTYELTPAGRAVLAACARSLQEHQRAVDRFIDRYQRTTGAVCDSG